MNKNQKPRNLVKAASVLVGAITIVCLVGYLIFQIITASSDPPNLHISSSYNSTSNFYKVEVENTGDITAEEVTIKLQIVGQGRTIDTVTITIPYVPAKSKKSAIVSLPQEESFKVNLNVVSIHYQTP